MIEIRDHYRNQRNSMDKIMTNKYPTPNIYRNIPNIERFGNMNQPKKKYILKKFSSFSLGGTDGFRRPKTNQD